MGDAADNRALPQPHGGFQRIHAAGFRADGGDERGQKLGGDGAAAHLILLGEVDKGLEIVRVCRRRYDGTRRNPFNEYECGHWYARALSSYSLLEALSGVRYDAVDQALRLRPGAPATSRSFLATEAGFGTATVAAGVPALELAR